MPNLPPFSAGLRTVHGGVGSGVLRSHIFIAQMHCNGVQLSSCSLVTFHAVWKELHVQSGMYSQALNESEVCFFQVKFIKFLRISANSTKLCDICCVINDFIAVDQQLLNIF